MRKSSSAVLLALACFAAGNASAIDLKSLAGTGMKAGQALTLSDADVAKAADQACAYMDKDNKIAPANSPYAQRTGQDHPGPGQRRRPEPQLQGLPDRRRQRTGPWPTAACACTRA
ncbi:hypothetical protein V8017_13685 [Stenotrophomonas rhizophila]